jgi:hypothetical protein
VSRPAARQWARLWEARKTAVRMDRLAVHLMAVATVQVAMAQVAMARRAAVPTEVATEGLVLR